jgi:hypothetical protein
MKPKRTLTMTSSAESAEIKLLDVLAQFVLCGCRELATLCESTRNHSLLGGLIQQYEMFRFTDVNEKRPYRLNRQWRRVP